jgi:hypothetical protein
MNLGKWLVILILFASYFSLSVNQAVAACHPDSISSNCGENYDCGKLVNDVTGIGEDPNFCNVNAPGSCYDSFKTDDGKIYTVCFQSKTAVAAAGDSSDMFCTFEGNEGVSTALGCVPVEARAFTMWLLSILFGIGGGIAFLLMIYGFVIIMTSKGDPKVVQGGKETITSAVTGLVVIIFAVFILRLIAYQVLRIPGITQ